MWAHVMKGLSTDPLSLSRECDWVTKYHLIERYRNKHDLALNAPRVGLIDLQYHDVNRSGVCSTSSRTPVWSSASVTTTPSTKPSRPRRRRHVPSSAATSSAEPRNATVTTRSTGST